MERPKVLNIVRIMARGGRNGCRQRTEWHGEADSEVNRPSVLYLVRRMARRGRKCRKQHAEWHEEAK
eukprot:1774533-Heterocapsa_arctica.AAC.1